MPTFTTVRFCTQAQRHSGLKIESGLSRSAHCGGLQRDGGAKPVPRSSPPSDTEHMFDWFSVTIMESQSGVGRGSGPVMMRPQRVDDLL